MSKRTGLKAALLTLLGFVRGAGRRREREPILPEPDEGTERRRAELVVALLLLGGAACAVMFIVVYALDWPHMTQYLGLCLGGALALLAAALILTGEKLIPTEELEEDYPVTEHPAEQDQIDQLVAETGSRFTRKRLLIGAAGAAGAALGAALVVPAASLGPALDTKSFYYSPWRRDRRLVDEDGKPYAAEDIEEGTFYTAYPEDAYRDELAAPLVVVRLDPDELEMPAGREGWTPEGIVAYSKICTHAGCAVALYRDPKFPAAEPDRALVCPCHYSTFDPARGAEVTYGPAGRPLPQLPLLVDSEGDLRAAGQFSEPVGPAFWGVRTRRPSA
ncbi:MAG TPA: Rieske 2Fe-2S domain-containing protein [Solirubrobacterales bacterium]|nr:Rieske 2Fe-2S domain-containing protein [Solirubrobacterales bacterium]